MEDFPTPVLVEEEDLALEFETLGDEKIKKDAFSRPRGPDDRRVPHIIDMKVEKIRGPGNGLQDGDSGAPMVSSGFPGGIVVQ